MTARWMGASRLMGKPGKRLTWRGHGAFDVDGAAFGRVGDALDSCYSR
jgi:hypothetical protein